MDLPDGSSFRLPWSVERVGFRVEWVDTPPEKRAWAQAQGDQEKILEEWAIMYAQFKADSEKLLADEKAERERENK